MNTTSNWADALKPLFPASEQAYKEREKQAKRYHYYWKKKTERIINKLKLLQNRAVLTEDELRTISGALENDVNSRW